MIDLSPFVRPGTGIWWSQASAEPTPLVHSLLDQADLLGPVHAFTGMSWDQRLTTALPAGVTLVSYGALGALRSLGRGRLQIVPCHYSALPRLFASGRLPQDVGLVQVSPPDSAGYCSLGIGVDYVADAIEHTPVLIAEINERMPPTAGSPRIPLRRFSAVVHSDRPLLEAPDRVPDDTDRAIARNIAGLIMNGATVQVGVGLLPTAVLEALSGHADLGVHSGIISDPVLRLVDKGVITGTRKEIDPGLIVTGGALGTAELYSRVSGLPAEFRPASYTHAPAVLARLRSLVAVNSALQVDLTGQVNAEMSRGRHLGGIGGQADFSRAAASTGSGSIIALRSSVSGHSTIVAALDGGVVTTGRADVDVVVTEHGVARLTGIPIEKRAARLIAIAAPEHREALERALARKRSQRTELRVDKTVPGAAAAVAGIPDRASIAVGGFGLCGIPWILLDALLASGVTGLSIVSNNCGTDGTGLGAFLEKGRIARITASYVGENREFERRYLAGELEVELTPQGTLAERLQAGGSGIGAFYTPTGVGTQVADGGLPWRYGPDGEVALASPAKEVREIDGRPQVLEHAIVTDYALVRAAVADTVGNLVFHAAARNFNPNAAMAGRTTIVEAEQVVPAGQIPADQVHLPGIFVHRVFALTPDQAGDKQIEKRTVRQ